MNEHEKINYVEFPTKDIEATKAFFSTVFGWSFIDYALNTPLSQMKVSTAAFSNPICTKSVLSRNGV